MRTQLLEPEGGVTEVSLRNAELIVKQHGLPSRLDFKANKAKCDYFVVASFPDDFNFVFSGFSWGYEGEGPSGLTQFFILAQVNLNRDNIPMDKYERTDCSWFRNIEDVTASEIL
jgi:hypothetical protein